MIPNVPVISHHQRSINIEKNEEIMYKVIPIVFISIFVIT